MEFKRDMAPLENGQPMGEIPPADTSHIKRKKLDIAYGTEHERQSFDIYYPEEGEGPFPVVLHIHGGGFAIGDKRDVHILDMLPIIDRGFALAACSYRRSGEAKFPAAVLDCRACLEYIHEHAEELNIDPRRIASFGGSAGGNLAAILAMNVEKFMGENKPIKAKVACCVDWFGPTAFELMDSHAKENGISNADHDAPTSPESAYLGYPLPEAPRKLLAAANPASYVSEAMCPLLIEHGSRDILVPYEQGKLLYDTVCEKLGPDRAIFLSLEGANHDDMAFKSPMNMDIVYAFLNKHLKNTEPALPIESMPVPHGMGSMFDGPPPIDGPVEPPKLSQVILDSIKEKYLDIPYCSMSESQKLDLYMPEAHEGKCPVIVHFHGGAFMMCSKRDDSLEPMLRALDRGYAVISAEYRKSGEAIYPAMVHDAKTVIRWVRANAEKYGFDTRRIAVWGPSSGGWLSSYIAVTNGDPAFEDLSMGYADYSSHVHACVDWCGPCGGFLNMDKAFRESGDGIADHDAPFSPESKFLGQHIVKVPELCELTDPRSHVKADTVPFIIVHGGADPVVPKEQSISFAQAINAAAGEERAELHIVPGKPHHGDPWYHELWLSELCLDFLDKALEIQQQS